MKTQKSCLNIIYKKRSEDQPIEKEISMVDLLHEELSEIVELLEAEFSKPSSLRTTTISDNPKK